MAHSKTTKWITKIKKEAYTEKSDYVVLRYIHRGSGSVQVAIIVSSKVGSAIVRNKIKRRIREILRTRIPVSLKPGFYLFIAQKAIVTARFNELQRDLADLTQRISGRRQ